MALKNDDFRKISSKLFSSVKYHRKLQILPQISIPSRSRCPSSFFATPNSLLPPFASTAARKARPSQRGQASGNAPRQPDFDGKQAADGQRLLIFTASEFIVVPNSPLSLCNFSPHHLIQQRRAQAQAGSSARAGRVQRRVGQRLLVVGSGVRRGAGAWWNVGSRRCHG